MLIYFLVYYIYIYSVIRLCLMEGKQSLNWFGRHTHEKMIAMFILERMVLLRGVQMMVWLMQSTEIS